MTSKIKKLFSVLWPLAILILPWQTRWIVTQGTIGPYAWEQGTIAFYVSWIALVLAAGFGLLAAGRERIKAMCTQKSVRYLALGVFLLLLSAWMTSSPATTCMWLLQVCVLALFVFGLVAARVTFAALASWFFISLIPEVVLGFIQYINQDAFASSWLGIAEHHPWTRGTSVVEHGLYRVLRTYAGFPHPNIFGGWLAIALVLIPTCVPIARYRYRPVLGILAAMFAFMLVLTFSRSAWLATSIGFLIAAITAFLASSTVDRKTAVILFSVAAIGSGLIGIATQWDHVVTRLQGQESLEQLSVLTRSQALREGFDAWKKRPIFGWGEGAADLGIADVRATKPFLLSLAPEPPHAAPVAAFVEVGIIGIIGATLLGSCLVLAGIRRQILRIGKKIVTIPYPDPFLITLIVLACVDHYLWTTWSGQALLAIAVAMIILQRRDSAPLR